jgi:hypothetical protein
MAGMSRRQLRRLVAGFRGRVAVETGTFEADTTRLLFEHFEIVHTIELNPERFDRCSAVLADTFAICHLGNSAELLPEICSGYAREPIFFYLDAHHIAARHLSPKRWRLPVADSFPLWAELAVIAERSEPDRVVVDDVHAFGRREKGWMSVGVPQLKNSLRRVRHCRILGDQWVAQLKATRR